MWKPTKRTFNNEFIVRGDSDGKSEEMFTSFGTGVGWNADPIARSGLSTRLPAISALSRWMLFLRADVNGEDFRLRHLATIPAQIRMVEPTLLNVR